MKHSVAGMRSLGSHTGLFVSYGKKLEWRIEATRDIAALVFSNNNNHRKCR
jgi:hypothetical protein